MRTCCTCCIYIYVYTNGLEIQRLRYSRASTAPNPVTPSSTGQSHLWVCSMSTHVHAAGQASGPTSAQSTQKENIEYMNNEMLGY